MTTVLIRTIIVKYAFFGGIRIDNIKEQLAQIDSLSSRYMNSYHPLAEKFGLSDATLNILCGISQLGRPCTQKELCEIWYLSKQTVNSCTKQLSAKGLITAAPSPNNFREKLITLTPAGRELCRNTAVRVYERECAALDTLSPEERQRLILLYKKYVDAIENEFAKILEDDT